MAWPLGYTVLPLLPSGTFGAAYGVSADSLVVVGEADDASFNEHAVYWTQFTGPIDLGFLSGGSFAVGQGANHDGSILVGYAGDSGGNQQPFSWTSGGGMVQLALLPTHTTGAAFGISSDGSTIVGESVEGAPSFHSHAVYWKDGGSPVDIGTLTGGGIAFAQAASSDGSVIVGQSDFSDDDGSGREAFRWTDGGGMVGIGHIFDINESQARGVSEDGTIVVGYGTDSINLRTAFRWTQGSGLVGLGFLSGGNDSFAVGTDATTVVGSANNSAFHQRAFTWTQADGMVALPDLAGVGTAAYDCAGISANGAAIVGEAPISGVTTAWVYGLSAPVVETVASIADLWFGQTDGFVDLSATSNRRLFVGLDGSGQYLGAAGERPFGTPPPVFLTRPSSGSAADTFAENAGTGAAFAITGGDLATATPGPHCGTYRVALDVPSNTPQGADPQVMLSVSDDGGRTFSSLQKWRSMGKIGEYTKRLRWLKMGKFRNRMIRLEITDSVRRNLVGFYLDVTEGLD